MTEKVLNTSFSTSLPTMQIAWDSTSLGTYKTCPRLYEYTIVRGFSGLSGNYHLIFGQIYHAALERYDHAKFAGASHEEAMMAAVDYALIASWDKKLKRPWISNDNKKNRFTLLRSIVWYIDTFRDDPMKTIRLANGKPAVELSFRFEAPFGAIAPTGESYILCGHLDRLAEFDDKIWINDRKTTGHDLSAEFFDRFSPDNQMSLYDIAGQIVAERPVSGTIIDAIQVMVTFSRFLRAPVVRQPTQQVEWLKDAELWIESAARNAVADYWPMNDKSCWNCSFRKICATSPNTRETYLNAQFGKRVWDPLQVRGDV